MVSWGRFVSFATTPTSTPLESCLVYTLYTTALLQSLAPSLQHTLWTLPGAHRPASLTHTLSEADKMSLIGFLLLALIALVNAAPLITVPRNVSAQDHSMAPSAVIRKRGISYNNPSYVRLFDHQDSKAYWMYNWDSAPGNTDRKHEYIPMLHSNRPDHTGAWNRNVGKRAQQGNGPIHVLSFNEPDQCGYVHFVHLCNHDTQYSSNIFIVGMAGPVCRTSL